MAKKSIAVLITCHNRREKTLKCLSALYECNMPEDYQLDVYLVDDGSTDGTSNAIKNSFPQVHLIRGDGKLFWNKGMRLAWKSAQETGSYSFICLLNDDTYLYPDAFDKIIFDYKKLAGKKIVPILAGCCKDLNHKTTFGGHKVSEGLLDPKGYPQECKYVNANLLLIPEKIFQTVGILSPEFTHAYGDFDYGLRAQESGFSCWVSSTYLAICQENEDESRVSFYKRLKWLYDEKHSYLKDLIIFKNKHEGKMVVLRTILAVFLKVISPKAHKKIKYLLYGYE